MDVRTLQKPFKDRYRSDPATSRITLTAHGSQVDAPIACSVDIEGEDRAILRRHADVDEAAQAGDGVDRVITRNAGLQSDRAERL
jgi:hypothetical protein